MQAKSFFLLLFILSSSAAHSQVKILFDATKAETAGNADWVIDADLYNLDWNPNAQVGAGTESNPQRIPTPAQSGITSGTSEYYWTGGLSAWGVDCVKKGYTVETLPYNGRITFGDGSNTQDLSHYKVFIVCEPNILFTSTEKTAMINFIKNGGGLFMISDHTISDRNGDGWDSPDIWNDFLSNNSVANDSLGISFDLNNFSQTSTNIPNLPSDSILHGPMGNVTSVQWNNGTSMTINPGINPTVKGVVYKTSSSFGDNNVLCAYARFKGGKVAAIGDSSPCDDGTGDINDVLYDGYFSDASGNHQRLLMNITIWLATPTTNTGIDEHIASGISIYPNPAHNAFIISLNGTEMQNGKLKIYDIAGREVHEQAINVREQILNAGLSSGVYFVKIEIGERSFSGKLVIE